MAAACHRRRTASSSVVVVLMLLLLQPFSFVWSSNSHEWTPTTTTTDAFRRRNKNPQTRMMEDGPLKEALQRRQRILSSSSSSSTSAYSNSMQLAEEEWNPYQLAWRLLGFYLDCSFNDGAQCQRMVMYAVYVDVDYQGGGFGEYEYYDTSKGEFVCYSNNDNSCREKMDCHLTDSTSWQMLGVFKISYVSDNDGWMEQLFKHEGVCVWGEDTYKFASEMRRNLPSECKEIDNAASASGTKLYYDLKPGVNATISLGLYTDDKCSLLYQGGDLDVFEITGNSKDDFDQFNQDLNTWKICQPCTAYSVSAADSDYYCYDEAGYENCNQCMKFSAKSGCEIASSRDITLAERQQTLVQFEMDGAVFGGTTQAKSRRSSIASSSSAITRPVGSRENHFLGGCFFFFVGCLALFVVSTVNCQGKRRRKRRKIDAVKDDALLRDEDYAASPKTHRSKNKKSPKHHGSRDRSKSPEGFDSAKGQAASPRGAKAADRKGGIPGAAAAAASLFWIPKLNSKKSKSEHIEIYRATDNAAAPAAKEPNGDNGDIIIVENDDGVPTIRSFNSEHEHFEIFTPIDDETAAAAAAAIAAKEPSGNNGNVIGIKDAENNDGDPTNNNREPSDDDAQVNLTDILAYISKSFSVSGGGNEELVDDNKDPHAAAGYKSSRSPGSLIKAGFVKLFGGKSSNKRAHEVSDLQGQDA